MKFRMLILAAALSVAIGPAAAQERGSAPRGRIFEIGGVPYASDEESGDDLLFSLWDPHVRFRVAGQPGGLDALAAIFSRSIEKGESAWILYDALEGQVNRTTGTIDYPLCRASLGDLSFQPAKACASGPVPGSPSGETALALAYAYSRSGDFPRAREMLRRARPAGDPESNALLLRISGDTEAGSVEEPWTPAADRAYYAALGDYRTLAELKPDDVEVQYQIAAMLEELGDYQAARALFGRIAQRWPEEDFRVAVRLGALYRREGDYVRALAQLDDYAARSTNGAEKQMKFHYHRGWTLTKLGRFADAVVEFDAGLETQPDFAYAYFHRACAKASLGRLSEAIADMALGRKFLAGLPFSSIPAIRFDLRRADSVTAELERASAGGGGRAVHGTCEGYWGHADEARRRSALLGPA